MSQQDHVQPSPQQHVFSNEIGPELYSKTHTDSYQLFQEAMRSLIEMQQRTLSAMLLPTPQVPTFRGNVMEYHAFIMAFDVRVVPYVANDTDKLYYLSQHLEGEARELIGGCIYMSEDTGYCTARSLLDTEYGDPYKVSVVYVDKLIAWPKIKANDGQNLKTFSYYLHKCLHVMQNISCMTVLNHIPNLQEIVRKLPLELQDKWCEQALEFKEAGHIVGFADMVKFVSHASKALNHPVYGADAVRAAAKRYTSKVPSEPESSSFVTHTTTFERQCAMCHGLHDLDECQDFNEKTVNEKRAFLRQQHKCYGCYGMNHISRNCPKKRICHKCGKCHPTALHVENEQFQRIIDSQSNSNAQHMTKCNNDNSTALQTAIVSSSYNVMSDENNSHLILQPILPVTVEHGDSGQKVMTYAMLDMGSNECFVSEELKDKLGADSTEAMLTIQTMNGKTKGKASVIKDLKVSDNEGNNPIGISKAYVKEISIGKEHIPSPKLQTEWPHLNGISAKLPTIMPELNIGLVIGSNCPLALQPLEVIPAPGNQGPFAVRHYHGWTVNGPVKWDKQQDT